MLARIHPVGLALVIAAHAVALLAVWRLHPAARSLIAPTPIYVSVLSTFSDASPSPPVVPRPVTTKTPSRPPVSRPEPQVAANAIHQDVPAAAPSREATDNERPQEAAAPAATPPVPAPVAVAAAAAPAQPVSAPRFDAAYLANAAPNYPPVARQFGQQGVVMLRVLVSPAGAPEEIELQTSSGWQRLDEAALDAVRRWRFVPAQQGHSPVAAWVVVPVRFALAG